MHPRGSGTSTSESFNDSRSSRRPTSPLVSSREAGERARLHEELVKQADTMFTSSKTIVDQLDSMHDACDLFGKWSLSAEVQAKMEAFKVALASDDDGTGQKLWDLIQADLIISHQQAKMNEMLLKNNADLKLQLAFARETVHRKQNDAVDTLHHIVTESLGLTKLREEEAFDWKNQFREQQETNEAMNKELRSWRKKLDEANARIAELERTRMAQAVDSEQLSDQLTNRENTIQKITTQLQELQKKNRELQMQIDQKTDEVVSLDHDVRKASVDMSELREKHKKELDRFSAAFEKKLDDDLKLLEDELTDKHSNVVAQFQQQISRLENERDMLKTKLADYHNHAEQLQNENDYLKRNSKKIKADLIAQCQRRVFSALNYDTQSTDSSPAERSRPASRTRNADLPSRVPTRFVEEERPPVREPAPVQSQHHVSAPTQKPTTVSQRPRGATLPSQRTRASSTQNRPPIRR